MSPLAKGPDCSGMSFQDWLSVTLGPDLGELALLVLIVAGIAAVAAMVAVVWRVMDWGAK